ncbi:NAD-dependent epimerase/dehydratase family protein [Candidatus Woesearchaeota archaeon]|nr:NAD-dependent epimerase/dehydratase family protein [Candidatus Woesearchaeota archaeon]
MDKILVTGAFGQIGSDLIPELQKKHGRDNVICLAHKNVPEDFHGIVEHGDVRKKEEIQSLIAKHKITQIYHLAGMISAVGEKNPQLAWDINMNGLKTILDICVENKLKLFWPSSIAIFGPTTPKDNTPQRTVAEPTTIYGVAKYAGELLCQYYHLKFNLDVRSLRYPGIISWKAEPGGGTTDYAVAFYYDALLKGHYTCFVREDTVLPMMYMDDAIRATLMLMDAPAEKIKVRTSYNLAAISFSAKEQEEDIRKHIPGFRADYAPDSRQKIADSWPRIIDDSEARKDWGWKHEFTLPKMTEVMLKHLKAKLRK